MITDLMGLIGDLQAKLMLYGNVDVMIEDRNGHILQIMKTEFTEAEEGEFPEDWNMPAGFKFISVIAN